VLSFDQNVSSYTTVLNNDNWPAPVYTNVPDFRGPFITDNGVQRWIWMADINSNQSSGIIEWPIGSDGIVPHDNVGVRRISAGPGTDLVFAPWDLAIDSHSNIFTVQRVSNNTDPTWRVLRYSAPDGLSPRTRVITNLTDGPGSGTSYMDVSWDHVGNVYGSQEEIWRAFSPPGPNHSTTVAIPVVEKIKSITHPVLSAPMAGIEQFEFTLTGQGNVTYLIETSPDLQNWSTAATNYSIQPVRAVQIAPTDNALFFRARVQPLPEVGAGIRRQTSLPAARNEQKISQ
jgi:hypothetical protein